MIISKLLRLLLRDYMLRAVDDDDADPVDGEEDQGDGAEDEQADADGDDHDADPDAEADPDGDVDPEAEGGLTVSLGDDEPQQEEERRAPEWVRNLRKEKRELTRTLRQKDEEIARLKGGAAQPAAVVVGDKPTLESCDFDAEKFERDLEAWHDRRRQVDEQKRTKEEAEKRDSEAWQRTQDAYTTAKGELKVANFDDAEGAVEESFNTTQRGILLHALAPKQAALMIYALGNNPKKLKELAAVTDPVKFTVALTKLEAQLKVNKSKAAPPPERTVRGTVSGAAVVDNQLERLRNEARKTGDFTKVVEFRRQQADKQRKRA